MVVNVMTEQLMFYEKNNHIATLFINNPDKKNAITLKMWQTFPSILEDLEADEEIRVVIIRGIDDKAFSAGGDIKEFIEERSSVTKAKNYDYYVAKAGEALDSFAKPLIAMIEGPCIGGGCDIALACDMRFTSSTGVLGITPAKIGLMYTVAQTNRLFLAVGASKAKDILFSARLLDANEAKEIGLVDRVYDSSTLEKATYEYAQLIAERAQTTVYGAKQIIGHIVNGTVESESEKINEILDKSYYSSDIKEGVSAFIEKRTPKFD